MGKRTAQKDITIDTTSDSQVNSNFPNSIEDAERIFNGRIFIDGNIVLNFLVEEGICTEDAECNLRGDIEILILFEKLIECCKKMIPSREERYSYRF